MWFFLLVGLAVGSFANVVIYRVPRGLSVVAPGSFCPGCNHPIAAFNNVPVLSWLVLRGRCKHCRMRIPVRYPLVELACAAVATVSWAVFGATSVGARSAVAAIALVILAVIDLDCRRVPNWIVLPTTAALLVWVGIDALLGHPSSQFFSALVCGAAGIVVLGGIALAAPGALGMGDAKLAALIGVAAGATGPGSALVGIMCGFIIAGVVAVVLLITRQAGRKTALPLAPMLGLGGIVGIMWGNELFRAWIGL